MITLTITASEQQIISGIPKSIEISTDLASTIYYTLDGTLPSLLSSVYTGAITLPTDGHSLTVSAIAYYFDGYSIVPSGILTNVYFTDVSALDRTRYVFFEGIVYSYPGGADIPLYYDYAGNATYFIDTAAEFLDFIEPDSDKHHQFVGTDNAVAVLSQADTGAISDDTPPLFASGNDAETFRADARCIVIDGRADAYQPPVIDFLNGPLMSLRNSIGNYSGVDYINLGKTNVFSGSATRYYYDRGKNVIVFTYFDSNSNRWIKSIQDLPSAPDPPAFVQSPSRFVHKWFPYGRHELM